MNKDIEKKVKGFISRYPKKVFKKGEIIIDSSKNTGFCFCLTKGVSRSFIESKTGVDLTVNMFKAISYFPVFSINGAKDRYSYMSVTEAEGHYVPNEDFKLFLKENNDVMFDLLKRIYIGLEGYLMMVESFLSNNAKQRFLVTIYFDVLRFGDKVSEGKYRLNFTQAILASQTGLARETITREISKLKTIGIVSYDKKGLVINSMDKLYKEVFN